MIKIAFVINSLETSSAGTEKQLLSLINGLDQNKFESHLVCLRSSNWLDNSNLPLNVTILNVPRMLSFNALDGVRRFREYLIENKIDIVHAHYFDSVLLSSFALDKLPHIKMVTSRRGFSASEKPQRIKRFILSRMSNRYDGIICNSQALAKVTASLEKIEPNRIKVIYNGIDMEKLDRTVPAARPFKFGDMTVEESDLFIVTTANLRPVKNIELLIKAAARLIKQYDNLRFVVLGEGGKRENLQSLINSFSLENHFALIGSVPDPEKIVSGADIAVLPSLSESLSNALIEYSALGRPVVASDVGGNCEVIVDQSTGLLFESNCLDSFVAKLVLLIKDRNLRNKLGANGKERARELFSRNQCINAYSKYYERIATQKS